MKQNKSTTQSLTEEIVRKIVREEIREELKDYPTKLEIEKLTREIDDNARQYRDDVLNRIDEYMGKNEQLKEDTEFNKYDIRVLKEVTDTHEKRITKLEHP